MKKLTIALTAIALSCNSLAEEKAAPSVDAVCVDTGRLAESIANARDSGIKLSDLISMDVFKNNPKTIALDVYKRIYLTPGQLSDSWVIKCYSKLGAN